MPCTVAVVGLFHLHFNLHLFPMVTYIHCKPEHVIAAHVSGVDVSRVDNFGVPNGTVSVGDLVGERALVDSQLLWDETAIGGAHGADIICIDRAMFGHFALTNGVTCGIANAQIAAALRVACCCRMLKMPAAGRSASDIDTLVSFLHNLEVLSEVLVH